MNYYKMRLRKTRMQQTSFKLYSATFCQIALQGEGSKR